LVANVKTFLYILSTKKFRKGKADKICQLEAEFITKEKLELTEQNLG